MQLLEAQHWKEYELIDSGNFRKLERFGQYTLMRPEPQAIWNPQLDEDEWNDRADAEFRLEKNDQEKGKWFLKPWMEEQWYVTYQHGGLKIKMRLGLTSFRHIGIFPEQSANWDFIYSAIKAHKGLNHKVLNLFAYTGGATLAAKAAGADVTHVDSVKPVINWAKDNMDASSLRDIRWVVEDALAFVKREVRRGNKYTGIILDPPAYGRGANGEKWILEDSINEMIMLCSKLLAEQGSFFILNMYSIGFSALVGLNLVDNYFKTPDNKEFGELYLPEKRGRKLPLGTFVRFTR